MSKYHYRSISIILFLQIVVAHVAYTQNHIKSLFFNYLTQADGLSQSINAYIFHDSHGFVWISSIDGLNRFDGNEVKVYREIPGDSTSLRGKNIYGSLFEDDLGNIWLTTLRGLQCYQRASDDFKQIELKDENGAVIRKVVKLIHKEGSDELWLKAEKELLLYNLSSGSVVVIPNVLGIEGLIFPVGGSNERILVTHFKGTQPGMYIYKLNEKGVIAESGSFFTDQESLGLLKIYDVWFNSKEDIWIAAAEGLVHLNTKSLSYTTFSLFNDQATGSIRSVQSYQDRFLFVSTEIGLLLFDLKKQTFVYQYSDLLRNPRGTIMNDLNELYLDPKNNLWVSMWGRGVAYANIDKPKFSYLQFETLDSDQQESIFEPGSIVEDKNNRIWLGSNKHGLMVLDQNYVPIRSMSNHSEKVKQLYLDQDGQIWALTWERKIIIYDKEGEIQQILSLDEFKDNSIGEIHQLRDGRIILTGASSPGLFEIIQSPKGAYVSSKIKNSDIPEAYYDRLFQCEDGRVLTSHNFEGLTIFHYDQKQFQIDTILNFDAEIKGYLEDKEGKCWIASTSGLISLDLTSYEWEMLGEKEGLTSSYVYGVLPDYQNNLWLSTNRGIFSYNKTDSVFRQYSLADGIQGFEYNSNSYLKTRNNQLWFGGINGYNVFQPEGMRDLPDNSHLNITGIEVNDSTYLGNKNINDLDTLNLTYWSNTFSFNLVSSEYSDPTSNKVRFKLFHANGKDFDKDWIVKSNLQAVARYPKIKSGSYELRVQGSNSDGVWNPGYKSIFVKIEPPFWERAWFILLCVLAIGLLSWLVVKAYVANRLRIKNLKIREQRLEIDRQIALQKERSRIARDMHDDLGTGLTQIRQTILNAKREKTLSKIKSYLVQMEDYAISLIENMQGIIWAMDGGQSSLEELIAYIRRYFSDLLSKEELAYKIEAPDNWPDILVPTEVKRSVFLAVKEAGHNILKHSQATEIQMAFNWTHWLMITIEDNGVGLNVNQSKSKGNGLKNMRSRMEEIGGNFFLENSDSGGLKLTFCIPLEQQTKNVSKNGAKEFRIQEINDN